MHFLEKFHNKTLKYDLINKFRYNNIKKLPKLKKIILNFGSKKADIKKLSSGLLAFELIANQKGILTTTKQPNVLLKIREGDPVGCKVTLQKQKLFHFFGKTIVEIFPKVKNFKGFSITRTAKENAISCELNNVFNFPELEKHYYFFYGLPKLNITLIATTKNKKEIIFILKSFQFPYKN